jgi:hypothetical protein
MSRCVRGCIRRRLGWWAAASLVFFIIALIATGGNAVLAAAIAGVTLGVGTLTIAANCYLQCRPQVG